MSYDSISPIDGRYRSEAEPLARYFSDRALMGARVRVELGYLGLLVKLSIAPKGRVPSVPADMPEIERLEEKLGHDVKAVEVYVRESLMSSGSRALAPFVHLGLTSEDTNSLAHAVLLKDALRNVMVPAFSSLAEKIAKLASREASTAMAARTHGRPAVPTTFGKEMAVFAVRIAERTSRLRGLTPMAKFSGAVGTYASFDAMGGQDWPEVLSAFVRGFGVEPAAYSTQVVPGERLSDILHHVINLNQLMSSLARDLWFYQTLDFLHFVRPGKVSSSTMPQKENPIDIENAEGQAEISTSLLLTLAYKLQQTRMQRDLSDSVLRRMVGQSLAHSLVACNRILRSLGSVTVERGAMLEDLRAHPEVLAERAQILKRLQGDARGYEKVRESIGKGRYVADSDPLGYLGESVRLAKECPLAVRKALRAS